MQLKNVTAFIYIFMKIKDTSSNKAPGLMQSESVVWDMNELQLVFITSG